MAKKPAPLTSHQATYLAGEIKSTQGFITQAMDDVAVFAEEGRLLEVEASVEILITHLTKLHRVLTSLRQFAEHGAAEDPGEELKASSKPTTASR